ncbi:hypothetical protein HU200_049422 [Digitaria exilis]|uniref:Uncharacterized protein n=1 Tax=Digitaria exilis TaxID=1010633 RepID=A0A835E6Z6_9POAL|nr:hypothetical protein HU200_049422 [Digitaria exilis]
MAPKAQKARPGWERDDSDDRYTWLFTLHAASSPSAVTLGQWPRAGASPQVAYSMLARAFSSFTQPDPALVVLEFSFARSPHLKQAVQIDELRKAAMRQRPAGTHCTCDTIHAANSEHVAHRLLAVARRSTYTYQNEKPTGTEERTVKDHPSSFTVPRRPSCVAAVSRSLECPRHPPRGLAWAGPAGRRGSPRNVPCQPELIRSTSSLYGSGSGRRRVSRDGGSAWHRLLRRLRSSLRRSAARPRREAVRFGYDLHSYSQNFDDGLAASSIGRRL